MINIAIDGPSAAGKSTVADVIAERLGYVHLDTGAMYRVVAYLTKEAGIKIDDEENIVNLINRTKFEMLNDGRIIINGREIKDEIRTNEISMLSSEVSKFKEVRSAMVKMQQAIAKNKGYILDGRDIGTVVLKDAELKIFLTASAKSRAERRVAQNKLKNIPSDYDKILEDIERRDYQDTHRQESPLRKAHDAIEIDTSDLSLEEVVDKIISLIDLKNI